jgi:hypothetical protein
MKNRAPKRNRVVTLLVAVVSFMALLPLSGASSLPKAKSLPAPSTLGGCGGKYKVDLFKLIENQRFAAFNKFTPGSVPAPPVKVAAAVQWGGGGGGNCIECRGSDCFHQLLCCGADEIILGNDCCAVCCGNDIPFDCSNPTCCTPYIP